MVTERRLEQDQNVGHGKLCFLCEETEVESEYNFGLLRGIVRVS